MYIDILLRLINFGLYIINWKYLYNCAIKFELIRYLIKKLYYILSDGNIIKLNNMEDKLINLNKNLNISRYMGLNPISIDGNNNHYFYYSREDNCYVPIPSYDSDWSALMSVVIRINERDWVTIYANECKIHSLNVNEFEEIVVIDSGEGLINTVYCAVLEYIDIVSTQGKEIKEDNVNELVRCPNLCFNGNVKHYSNDNRALYDMCMCQYCKGRGMVTIEELELIKKEL